MESKVRIVGLISIVLALTLLCAAPVGAGEGGVIHLNADSPPEPEVIKVLPMAAAARLLAPVEVTCVAHADAEGLCAAMSGTYYVGAGDGATEQLGLGIYRLGNPSYRLLTQFTGQLAAEECCTWADQGVDLGMPFACAPVTIEGIAVPGGTVQLWGNAVAECLTADGIQNGAEPYGRLHGLYVPDGHWEVVQVDQGWGDPDGRGLEPTRAWVQGAPALFEIYVNTGE